VRTDNRLDDSFKNDKHWGLNPTTGKVDPGIERFDLFGHERLVHSWSGHERNHLFLNQAGSRFRDISALTGLDSEADSRSFIYWDFDQDGWQDIAVVNANRPFMHFYRNRLGDTLDIGATSNHSIAVRFIGGNSNAKSSDHLSARDGFGATVVLSVGDQQFRRENRCGEGFASTNSPTMLIGIGPHSQADSLSISWPSGKTQQTSSVPADSLVTVYENPADSSDGSGFTIAPYRTNEVPKITQTDNSLAAPVMNIPGGVRMYTTMATWCPSCKKHLPQFDLLRRHFDETQLNMIGVPIDEEDTLAKLRAYKAEYRPGYKMMIGAPAERVQKIKAAMLATVGRDVLPTTLVIDGSGTVLAGFAGVPTISELRSLFSREHANALRTNSL